MMELNCKIHANYPLEYICVERTCQPPEELENSSRFACAKCHLSGVHKNHKFEEIEVFRTMMKDQFPEILAKIHELQEKESIYEIVDKHIEAAGQEILECLKLEQKRLCEELDGYLPGSFVADEIVSEFTELNDRFDKEHPQQLCVLEGLQLELALGIYNGDNVLEERIGHDLKKKQEFSRKLELAMNKFDVVLKQSIEQLETSIQEVGQDFADPKQENSHLKELKSKNLSKVFKGKVEKELQGHQHWVNTVLLLDADKDLAASGSNDFEVRIWNIKTGNCLHTMKGHANSVYCLAEVSKQKCLLASGSLDNSIFIWDYVKGEALKTIFAHEGGVYCIHMLNDRYLASGSTDKSIAVWDIDEFAQVQEIENAHSGKVWCLQKLPHQLEDVKENNNGEKETIVMASGAADKDIKIWDILNKKVIQILKGHNDEVICLALLNDRSPLQSAETDVESCLLASGSSNTDRTVRIWNYHTGTAIEVLRGHEAPVWCIVQSGAYEILTASYDCTMRFWDIQEGCIVRETHEDQKSMICSVAMLKNNQILTGGTDKTVKIWS